MNKIIELRQKRSATIDAMAKVSDAAATEERDLTAEEQSTFDDLKAEIESLAKQIARLEEVEALQLENMRSAGTATQGQNGSTRTAPAYNKTRLGDSEERAVGHYLRTGDNGGLQQRASNDTIMNLTTAADGGYAVPTGHYQGIIAKRSEKMLAEKLGLQKIFGKGLTVNVTIDNEADGEFVTKAEQIDDYSNTFDRDSPALGTVAMTLVKYTKKVPLTDELLEDEDSRLMEFLNDWVGRGMAKTHNSLLLTAILAGGTAALTLDSATAIGAAEIPELSYTLSDDYVDGTEVWLMRRATEGYLRGLRGDQFLFENTPNGTGSTRSLDGAPVHNTAYAGALAASGKSLVFLNPYFVGIREGQEISFLRDPYTTDGIVYLKYYYRVVYKVLQAEAVRYATHPTA